MPTPPDAAAMVAESLSRIERLRHPETNAHEAMVGHLAERLALTLGLEPGHAAAIRQAAVLHDIGKVTIPDAILYKPSGLTAAEMAVVRGHCRFGHDVLRNLGDPVLDLAARLALEHHEAWDGSGYPDRLAGEAIAIESRIVHLCDVYEALRSVRPYKGVVGHAEARSILLHGDGRTRPEQFDPAVLAAFMDCEESFSAVYQRLTQTAASDSLSLSEDSRGSILVSPMEIATAD
ncbi:MAG TPA: HD domain-containing phosphohydrolase [Alphaproteobacteria bacterium]|nr:HD domain-containing phosphohydrolase [Alphaproteobacteria bacterium]